MWRRNLPCCSWLQRPPRETTMHSPKISSSCPDLPGRIKEILEGSVVVLEGDEQGRAPYEDKRSTFIQMRAEFFRRLEREHVAHKDTRQPARKRKLCKSMHSKCRTRNGIHIMRNSNIPRPILYQCAVITVLSGAPRPSKIVQRAVLDMVYTPQE